MLERILGNTWVTVTAFIVGPAILVWLWVRRSRIEGQAAKPAESIKRQNPPSDSPPASAEATAGTKPVWPGFGALRWGQAPQEGMRLVHEEGEVRFMARPADELQIGSVQLSSIVYTFRHGRLEAVVIELAAGGFELLRRNLKAEWGPPRPSVDRSRDVWSTQGNGPDDSQAILEKRPESRSARLVISSRSALAERSKS